MRADQLPVLYHAHHSRHMEDLPFWLSLAKSHPGEVLELGCGTGRILLPVLQAGYKAIGLDNDLDMLRFLINQWPLKGAPPVFQADMAHFHLAAEFSLILLPCNTLSTLSSTVRRRVFDHAAALLSPMGLFSASLSNPQVLLDLPAHSDSEVEEVFNLPPDGSSLQGEPIQVSSSWARSREDFTVSWHYDHLLPDGRADRLTVKARHLLTPTDEYLAELRQSGFTILDLFGDFDSSPYTPDSPSLIILAQKGG